jgi:hypothetical protein
VPVGAGRIQSSLYHFLPDASSVVERMIAAAEKQVLIAEPIRNVAHSRIRALAFFARKLTNPGTGDQPSRFNEARLDALIEQYRRRGHAVRSQLIAGGREKLYIVEIPQIGYSLGGGKAKPAGAAE